MNSGGMVRFRTARRLRARSFRVRLYEYAGRSNVLQRTMPPLEPLPDSAVAISDAAPAATRLFIYE